MCRKVRNEQEWPNQATFLSLQSGRWRVVSPAADKGETLQTAKTKKGERDLRENPFEPKLARITRSVTNAALYSVTLVQVLFSRREDGRGFRSFCGCLFRIIPPFAAPPCSASLGTHFSQAFNFSGTQPTAALLVPLESRFVECLMHLQSVEAQNSQVDEGCGSLEIALPAYVYSRLVTTIHMFFKAGQIEYDSGDLRNVSSETRGRGEITRKEGLLREEHLSDEKVEKS
ncbi:hypothetical protein TNCV_4785921 [Trichonephila clavipes]|nr:hypothetical protein TNCV_4785921 [Trichonephila clavipes]